MKNIQNVAYFSGSSERLLSVFLGLLEQPGHCKICLLALLTCDGVVSSFCFGCCCNPLATFLISAMDSATPRLQIRCSGLSGVLESKLTGLGDWTLEFRRLGFLDLDEGVANDDSVDFFFIVITENNVSVMCEEDED